MGRTDLCANCPWPIGCGSFMSFAWLGAQKEAERLGYERVLGKVCISNLVLYLPLSGFRHFRNGGVIEPASLGRQRLLSLLDFRHSFEGFKGMKYECFWAWTFRSLLIRALCLCNCYPNTVQSP